VNVERPLAALSPQRAAEVTYPLMLAEGEPVRLQARAGFPRFGFSLRQRYQLVHIPEDPERGPWKVRTVDYYYAVHDDQGKELFAYHYHPGGRSRMQRPHVHFRALTVTRPEFEAAHYPTGRVALEEVLWMLLDEQDNKFGVRPLRANWREVLQRGLAAFERWRTWPGPEALPPSP
jgi:hypothetical protein